MKLEVVPVVSVIFVWHILHFACNLILIFHSFPKVINANFTIAGIILEVKDLNQTLKKSAGQ